MVLSKNINGINYSQFVGNENNNKILIFLPGMGSKKENYESHLLEFVNYYKIIYSLDLPEQGSKGEWRIGVMVDNLKEFINLINVNELSKIHLAGHSAGAMAILAFLFNYDSKIEDYIIEYLNIDACNMNEIYSESKLLGFMNSPSEAAKIEKILLYSPPIYMNNRTTKFVCNYLKNKKQKPVKKILNRIINYPLLFIRIMMKGPPVGFEIDKSKSVQYFNLIIKNHKNFFTYIESYPTIFKLLKINFIKMSEINKSLENINILIQYGNFDWLIKSLSCHKNNLLASFEFHKNIIVKKHLLLGHFLRKKLYLDLNLNNQMIINKKVISISTDFIKGLYGRN